MNEEKHLTDEAWRAVAAEQDTLLAQRPGLPDAVAEEAVRRAWPRTRRTRFAPYLAMAGMAAAVASVVAFFVARAGHDGLRFDVAGRAGQAGATVTAADGTPLPLRFSDGSMLLFQPGAQARVAHLHDDGAELLLDSGYMIADVQHTGQARWSVVAGPFKIHVTGTRFGVDWSPATGKLAVQMLEGSVMVDGPTLGQGLALRAGDSLAVGIASPAVVMHAAATRLAPAAPVTAPEPAQPPPAASPSEQPAPSPASEPVAAPRAQASWSELAANRRYSEAVAAAEREGFHRLCRQLDASGLLALGDAARYASSPARARQAYEALVRRFSRDQRSHDALFALGRLEFQAGAPATAAKWFERYLTAAPNPPLGEEAAGLLVEIYDHAGDDEAARRAASRYLEGHPDGLRASLARRVLAARSSTKAP